MIQAASSVPVRRLARAVALTAWSLAAFAPSAPLVAAAPADHAPAPAPSAPPASDADAADPSLRVLLVPARETTLVAQMVGTVQRLGGDIGTSFVAGAPLVSIDCGEVTAKLNMAQAELTAARDQLDTKRRLRSLNAAGDLEVSQATSQVDRASAQVDVHRAQSRQCRANAPFAGRIVKLHVREFQGVNIGQPLVDIVSSGPLKVRLNAPSKWLGWLKIGAPFEIAVDETGRNYPARVTAINGRVDAASQSIEVEGSLQQASAELLAGMSGQARFAQAANRTR